MINRNGGYAIIDLKGKTLSGTPTTILGTHSAIAKAIAGSKPILLTGLTTGGPCFVQIAADGTSYVISGVYGNDITVTSADAVTSAAVSGGSDTLTWSLWDETNTYVFAFEKGMTFAQFAASDYNINDAVSVTDSNVIVVDKALYNYADVAIVGSDDILTAFSAGIHGFV